MQKVGRNDPCPCGSGKKFKNCHQEVEESKGSRKGFFIGLLILMFIALGIAAMVYDAKNSDQRAPTKEGKVWSEEHGHYH